jgi:starch phosphorylase
MLQQLLPRHVQLIYEINRRFLLSVSHLFPDRPEVLGRVSIFDEYGEKRIRMANLAIVGSHKVNGVSALHSQLLKDSTFKEFNEIFPDKIINVTNGITPRRWLLLANPKLSDLIKEAIGDGWEKDLDQLVKLEAFADDKTFQQRFMQTKQANKQRLARLVDYYLDRQVSSDTLFDVQVKRFHEYKRQLLNIIRVVALYVRMLENPQQEIVPRTFIFGGKAAPGYQIAKLIIRLINDVADIIDNDREVNDRLKVLFIPNYDVSTAVDIIPAAEVSQQISTAGLEASGTGNMKLALNGALTMGTMDGANVEMHQKIGDDNIFIFGLTTDEITQLRRTGYHPRQYYENNPLLKRSIDMIGNGFFSPEETHRYRSLTESLLNHDPFMVLADFQSYLDTHDRTDQVYKEPDKWNRMAILNTARMGYFSSDRTIREYAKNIWNMDG